MLDCKKALEASNGNMEEATTWLREKGISKAAKKADRIAAEGLVNIVVNENKASIIELNSETDFVASNVEFTNLLDTISNLVVSNDVDTIEEALNLTTSDGTLNDTIVALIAKIGEKLSLRRFNSITKSGNEVFGVYIHNTKKIATLILLDGGDEIVAKNIAMHASAMRPKYVNRSEISTQDLDKEREVQKQIAINEGKPADIAEKMVEGRINKFYKEVCLEEQEYIMDSDISVGQYAKNNNATIKQMIRYEVGEGMEKRSDNFAEEVMSQIKK
jgi:elongation factor Ts